MLVSVLSLRRTDVSMRAWRYSKSGCQEEPGASDRTLILFRSLGKKERDSQKEKLLSRLIDSSSYF